MPPWAQDIVQWWFEWHIHWNVGNRRLPVPCLMGHGLGRCAVCEQNDAESKAAMQAGVSDEAKRQIQARTSLRDVKTSCLINAVDLDHPVKVQDVNACTRLMRQLIKCDKSRTHGISDPQHGYNLTINKTKSGAAFTFEVLPDEFPTPVSDPSWLMSLIDLSKRFTMYTYNQQVQLMLNQQITSDPEQIVLQAKIRSAATASSGVSASPAVAPLAAAQVPAPTPAQAPAPVAAPVPALVAPAVAPPVVRTPPPAVAPIAAPAPTSAQAPAPDIAAAFAQTPVAAPPPQPLVQTPPVSTPAPAGQVAVGPIAAAAPASQSAASMPPCFGEFDDSGADSLCKNCGVRVECATAKKGKDIPI